MIHGFSAGGCSVSSAPPTILIRCQSRLRSRVPTATGAAIALQGASILSALAALVAAVTSRHVTSAIPSIAAAGCESASARGGVSWAISLYKSFELTHSLPNTPPPRRPETPCRPSRTASTASA